MSFKDRVQAIAFETISDPTSSTDDRRAAKAALVDGGGAAVAQLRKVTAKLTPGDRAAVLRFTALVADPNASYDPPAPVKLTIVEHLRAIAKLDPTFTEVRRLFELDRELGEALDQISDSITD